MPQPSGSDAGRHLIKRIDRAFAGLAGIFPGDAPYLRGLSDAGWSGTELTPELLQSVVVDVAADLYTHESAPPVELLEFSDGAFEVMFDAVYERTVLMHGLSKTTPPKSRDKAYQRGFPQRSGFDKGHAMAHAHGGREGGPNTFPQNPLVNQRLSPIGHLWRDIEAYLAAHAGVYSFVRLVYHPQDSIDIPRDLEYGVLVEGLLRVVTFPNT